MRVALLRVMPQDRFRSIEVYSDRLVGGLRGLDGDLEIIEVRVQAWEWGDLGVRMPYGRRASLRTLGIYLSRWVKYPLALRRVQADVYHVLDNSYGHLAFFLDPKRTVVTSHGGTPRTWRDWNPEGPAMWVFDLAFRGTLRAGHIIAVSEYAKRELVEEYGYPADRVRVVHHGVDPVFQPQPESVVRELRGRLLAPGERYLILHVGHSARRKNVEALYEAFGLLRERGVPARLVRVGGNPTPAQAGIIRRHGIGSFVTHIPHVDNRDLPPFYAAADVFVFPSLYEGFGIPLIEAMACGTPVVCSDWSLFREVCGDAALFADPRDAGALSDAILDVLERPELARRLGELGLERARAFTWERTARETLEVYREVVDGG